MIEAHLLPRSKTKTKPRGLCWADLQVFEVFSKTVKCVRREEEKKESHNSNSESKKEQRQKNKWQVGEKLAANHIR